MKEAETPASPEYQAKYHALEGLLQGENRRVFRMGNEQLTVKTDKETSRFVSYKGEIIALHHIVTLETGTNKAKLACLYDLSPSGIVFYGEIVTSNILNCPHINSLAFDRAKDYDFMKKEEDRQFAQEEDQRRKLNLETLAFKVVERFITNNPEETSQAS